MDLKETFVLYEEKRAAVAAAKEAYKKAEADCSMVVKEIYEAIAPKKDLTYKGRRLSVCKRGDTYFIRGFDVKDDDSIVID